jgi:hypothetical protein
MAKAYCLLNHSLTDNQTTELKEKFDVSDINYPTKELSASWSQIPATDKLDMSIIDSVVAWLKDASKDDILIIQGEFGSTFMIVDYALKAGLIPVHAVTKRVASEEKDGETVKRAYIFQHVCFRKYSYF